MSRLKKIPTKKTSIAKTCAKLILNNVQNGKPEPSTDYSPVSLLQTFSFAQHHTTISMKRLHKCIVSTDPVNPTWPGQVCWMQTLLPCLILLWRLPPFNPHPVYRLTPSPWRCKGSCIFNAQCFCLKFTSIRDFCNGLKVWNMIFVS